VEAREEPDGTATRREPDSDSAAWAFFARASRLMTRPVRAVAGASGIDVPRRIEEAAVDAVATPTAERTLDEILAGPLPEMIGRSLGRNRVIERIVAEAVKHDDFDRSVTSALESERTARLLREILASPAIERLVGEALQSGASDRVLRSPEFDRALGQVLSSPEVRRALTRQSTSFAGETAAAARRRSVALDAAAERGPRRWLRRPPRATAAGSPVPVPHAGIATRGLALAADAALTLLAFAAVGALVGLIGSLFGELRPQWLVALLAGSALLVLEIVYFVGFWSTVGQTPGMRMMRVRVLSRANETPGFWRSLVRLAGLALAIIPCFLGFLPALVDNRRRALPDFIAGTVVVYEEYAPAPGYVAPS
jgi:uncharacterized RDD family membrane protein YckC